MNDYREAIWGIQQRDRKWFQLMTLAGGMTGAGIMTWLSLTRGPAGDAPAEMALNILLGIGASFVASGFIAWAILQAKELIMSMADWIREATERRRQRLLDRGIEIGTERGIEQGIQQGIEKGIEQGIEKGIEQGIEKGIEIGRQQMLEEIQRKRNGESASPESDSLAAARRRLRRRRQRNRRPGSPGSNPP